MAPCRPAVASTVRKPVLRPPPSRRPRPGTIKSAKTEMLGPSGGTDAPVREGKRGLGEGRSWAVRAGESFRKKERKSWDGEGMLGHEESTSFAGRDGMELHF